MRLLTSRRTAASVICAALTLGTAGAASAHSDSAAGAPLPQAPTLLKQVQPVDHTGDLVVPVAELLNAVVKADNGKLSTTVASKYNADIDAVIEAIKKANAAEAPASPSQPNQPGQPSRPNQPGQPSQPNQPGQPSSPNAPANPNAPAQPAAPNAPVDETTADDTQIDLAVDAMDQALADIDKRVDELIKASTEGQTAAVSNQVQSTLKAVADFLAATAKNMQGTPATNLPAPNDMTQTPAV
ncbi:MULTISPECIES: hypothetical protein [unclassified Streptomyces]|uniref:hypothetical protein n=1 Tax=unclassified Streptomyces TaxID=2593676 RepID=UPI0033A75AA2